MDRARIPDPGSFRHLLISPDAKNLHRIPEKWDESVLDAIGCRFNDLSKDWYIDQIRLVENDISKALPTPRPLRTENGKQLLPNYIDYQSLNRWLALNWLSYDEASSHSNIFHIFDCAMTTLLACKIETSCLLHLHLGRKCVAEPKIQAAFGVNTREPALFTFVDVIYTQSEPGVSPHWVYFHERQKLFKSGMKQCALDVEGVPARKDLNKFSSDPYIAALLISMAQEHQENAGEGKPCAREMHVFKPAEDCQSIIHFSSTITPEFLLKFDDMWRYTDADMVIHQKLIPLNRPDLLLELLYDIIQEELLKIKYRDKALGGPGSLRKRPTCRRLVRWGIKQGDCSSSRFYYHCEQLDSGKYVEIDVAADLEEEAALEQQPNTLRHMINRIFHPNRIQGPHPRKASDDAELYCQNARKIKKKWRSRLEKITGVSTLKKKVASMNMFWAECNDVWEDHQEYEMGWEL